MRNRYKFGRLRLRLRGRIPAPALAPTPPVKLFRRPWLRLRAKFWFQLQLRVPNPKKPEPAILITYVRIFYEEFHISKQDIVVITDLTLTRARPGAAVINAPEFFVDSEKRRRVAPPNFA